MANDLKEIQLWAPLVYKRTGITKDHIFGEKRVLHLGCGKAKLPSSLGVDILSFPSVDLVHDLDQYPYPLKENSYDIIFAHSILEHLEDVPRFFEEIWRIGKHRAHVIIGVPYFRSVDSFTDPTHAHFFTSHSLDYFLSKKDSSLAGYQYIPYSFDLLGFWYGWPHPSMNPFVRLMKKIMHRYRTWYDQYLSLLIPSKIIIWELRVNKEGMSEAI